ncbi:hypothetical protein ACSFBC_08055 [Variovorax sp. LT1R16]
MLYALDPVVLWLPSRLDPVRASAVDLFPRLDHQIQVTGARRRPFVPNAEEEEIVAKVHDFGFPLQANFCH